MGAGHQKDMRETLARQKVMSIGSVVRERLLVDYKSHKGHIDATISVNSYRDEPPDKYIGDTQGEPLKELPCLLYQIREPKLTLSQKRFTRISSRQQTQEKGE